MLKGNSISPFLIVAKKWGSRINTLIYTGPEREFTPEESKRELFYQVNASMHDVLLSGNFVGVEVNDEFSSAESSGSFAPANETGSGVQFITRTCNRHPDRF
jgi:hypothetical protein